MKWHILAIFTLSTVLAMLGGCASSGESVHTAADTQPRSYMQDVNNPRNQAQFDRTGAMHY
jgi:hypothetical protein